MVRKKRELFSELMAGVEEMKSHREGKITLRTYKVEVKPLRKVTPKMIAETRRQLRMSRAVFARTIRVNARTLESWEQGRSEPNEQAMALIMLVRRFPETLTHLAAIA
jgi:putative transcriptional regulator